MIAFEGHPTLVASLFDTNIGRILQEDIETWKLVKLTHRSASQGVEEVFRLRTESVEALVTVSGRDSSFSFTPIKG